MDNDPRKVELSEVSTPPSNNTADSSASIFTTENGSTNTSISLLDLPLDVEFPLSYYDFNCNLQWEMSSDPRPLWVCSLCSGRQNREFDTLDAFKGHVASMHARRYTYYCPMVHCDFRSLLKERVYDHIHSKHAVDRMSNELIRSTEAPVPMTCPICRASVDSWDRYFSCLADHCYFQRGSADMEEIAPLPPSGTVEVGELTSMFLDFEEACGQKRPNPCETEPSVDGDNAPRICDGGMNSLPVSANTLPKIDNKEGEDEGHRIKRTKQESTYFDIDPLLSSRNEDHSHESQTTGEITPSTNAEDSSPDNSQETDITIPEYEAYGSIDGDITEPNDLSCVLDAANYYENLDELEMKTAQICDIDGSLDLQDRYSSLADCFAGLIQLKNAFGNLKTEGFCGHLMIVLVEDQYQLDIASAVQISQDQINLLANSIEDQPEFKTIDPHILSLVWKLQGKDYPQKASEMGLPELSFLCSALSIGLLSFSGSHVCRFDINIAGQPMEKIPIGLGYSFSLRKLACLDNFIGGPAWVLGKSDSQPSNQEMRVSLTVQDLQQLWGPVWMLGDSPEESLVIRTERGYVVPLPHQSLTMHGIECHWMKELPQSLGPQEHRPLLHKTTRILIGTDSTKLGLTVNDKCQVDISLVQRQIACQLQLPGASKARLIDDGYEVSLAGGSYMTAGVTKKWKRMPARTHRSALVELCKKSQTPLVPLLGLRVGLEISGCTRNAQRVTLWEALLLSQGIANNSTGPSCEHKVGDMKCINSCWNRRPSTCEIDSLDYFSTGNGVLTVAEARRLIVNSILSLEHTGIDGEGNMQAWWPFSDAPLTCRIPPTTAGESNNWFRVVKDTRDMSTFAVLSRRCLNAELACVRGCPGSCKNGHMKLHRTGLYTRLLSTKRELGCLREGAKLLVGDVRLVLERPLQTDRAAVIMASVSMNPLAYKFQGLSTASRVREQADYNITTGLAIPALVY